MSEPYYGKPVSPENWLDEIGMTEVSHEIPKTTFVEGDEVRWASKHNRWMKNLIGEILQRFEDSVTVMWYSQEGYSHFGTYNISDLNLVKNADSSLYI